MHDPASMQDTILALLAGCRARMVYPSKRHSIFCLAFALNRWCRMSHIMAERAYQGVLFEKSRSITPAGPPTLDKMSNLSIFRPMWPIFSAIHPYARDICRKAVVSIIKEYNVAEFLPKSALFGGLALRSSYKSYTPAISSTNGSKTRFHFALFDKRETSKWCCSRV